MVTMSDTAELYYTPPPNWQFVELKDKAIEIWKAYEHPSYVEKKLTRIKDLENIQDNFMMMVAMFDLHNQRKLTLVLTNETRQAIQDRLLDGGSDLFTVLLWGECPETMPT